MCAMIEKFLMYLASTASGLSQGRRGPTNGAVRARSGGMIGGFTRHDRLSFSRLEELTDETDGNLGARHGRSASSDSRDGSTLRDACGAGAIAIRSVRRAWCAILGAKRRP